MTHHVHGTAVTRLRRARWLCVCAALALTTAACGGDDDDDAGTGASSSDAAADDASDGTSPADAPPASDAPSSRPSRGGKLVVGTIFDPFGLEPTTFVGGVTDAHIAMALYDPLTRLTPDGTPEPFLAKSVKTRDDQTYTITLHEGVTFHDGTPLDAEAVKINLERHMDPATQSRALANAANIDTITVVDDLTVRVVLKFPWAAFTQLLAGNLGLIASPRAIQAGKINEEPVGSGPFMLSERVPGDHTTVVRNPDYWLENRPYLDEITYRVIPDDEVRKTSVENGEIQAGQSIRADALADADSIDGVSSTSTPGRVNTIHINNTVAPFDDVRVRQALAYALDYDALNEVIYDGVADPAHGFISSESPYYDASVEYPEYDPERAAALIAEYEAEHGPVSFTFRCFTEPSRVQLTELATQMWTAAGMDVKTDITDQTTLVIDLFQGNYAASCFSMSAETDDPDVMWHNTLHSESPTNSVKYSNPEMDEALTAGRTSTDEATRREAYSTVQRLLATETPLIQYMASPWGWVISDDIGGLVSLPGGEFVPSEVYFAS